MIKMTIDLSQKDIDSLELLTQGGEAKIYKYKSKYLLKIFSPKVDISKKEKKVKAFIKMNLPDNVMAPLEIVKVNGEFAGYMMRYVKNGEILRTLTNVSYLKKEKLTNNNLVHIMIKLGQDIETLHKLGIILGDVSSYNFMLKDNEVYFIDTDSWGIEGDVSPDAYTNEFLPTYSYNSNGTIKFSQKADMYGFAILTFNILTRIHPFNGMHPVFKTIDVRTRMDKKLSVLGNHNIIIPKMIPSWDWMIPDLKQAFLDIFENDKEVDIVDKLKLQIEHVAYCTKHRVFYNSKLLMCPQCFKETNNIGLIGMKEVEPEDEIDRISVELYQLDCKALLSRNWYISRKGKVVNILTDATMDILNTTKRIYISPNEEYIAVGVNLSDIALYAIDGSSLKFLFNVSVNKFNPSFILLNDSCVYVDHRRHVKKVSLADKDVVTEIGKIDDFNLHIIGTKANGEVIVIRAKDFKGKHSTVPRNGIVPSTRFMLDRENINMEHLSNCIFKLDNVTGKALIIYRYNDTKCRTVVIDDKIVYDSKEIEYNLDDLSLIGFNNDTIYMPAENKILAFSYAENKLTSLPCNVVKSYSKLEFNAEYISVINQKDVFNIYLKKKEISGVE